MTGWLDGKRALVVGAGSGIGRAVAAAFRAEGAEVTVLEPDRDKCERLGQGVPAGALPAPFDEMFRTNVLSHLQSVKAAMPALRATAGSSIVLTESTSSYSPGRGGALYVSSKFAVRGLVATLAHELAPQIRVHGGGAG